MPDLVTQAKEALTSTLTKVDDALTAAAPTSAETEDVPDPITGASTHSTPARKPSSASEEKIAALSSQGAQGRAARSGRAQGFVTSSPAACAAAPRR
jgi:hypothetical protein